MRHFDLICAQKRSSQPFSTGTLMGSRAGSMPRLRTGIRALGKLEEALKDNHFAATVTPPCFTATH
jgi:hypothetical protein